MPPLLCMLYDHDWPSQQILTIIIYLHVECLFIKLKSAHIKSDKQTAHCAIACFSIDRHLKAFFALVILICPHADVCSFFNQVVKSPR